MIEAAWQQEFRPLPPDFTAPRLGSGGTWTGGSLSREELYGADGR